MNPPKGGSAAFPFLLGVGVVGPLVCRGIEIVQPAAGASAILAGAAVGLGVASWLSLSHGGPTERDISGFAEVCGAEQLDALIALLFPPGSSAPRSDVARAVARLLPELTAAHAAGLSSAGRLRMLRALRINGDEARNSRCLTLAVLDFLSRFGDIWSEKQVRKLLGSHTYGSDLEIVSAARSCLASISERVTSHAQFTTLIRASSGRPEPDPRSLPRSAARPDELQAGKKRSAS
ncbi:MAG TPA: hypothetical protein VGS41_16240 [Chthonomonadales bacterium]|nr:hypothetical protein [Chthonomonadales bacterium]